MAVGNNFNFIGRITDTPELTDAGSSKVCHFTLASNNYKKGEQYSIFPEFEAWGDIAERICSTVTKGKRIGVVARYDESTWQDREGHNRKSIKFVVEGFMFLDVRDDNAGQSDTASSAPRRTTSRAPASAPVDVISDDMDDVPF